MRIIRVARAGAVSLLIFSAACAPPETAQAQDGSQTQRAAPLDVDTMAATRLSATFRAAARRALPAVVFIEVQHQGRTASAHPPVPEEFRRFFPDGLPMPNPQQPSSGSGSGFIFDPRGYILTNRHVVRNADRVQVHLLDGRRFDAEVVGADPSTDVAVIKVEAGGDALPAADFGNSDGLDVGDWVLALGNPMDLRFSVTAGIVSAQGRSIGILNREVGNEALESFIQTDAAINPGNSGGPLVDLHGRVIGINTAIESPTGTFAGYGFAVPINLARRVADDLMRYGALRRPRLGVAVQTVNDADAELYKLPSIAGAEVSSLSPDSPAADAGVQLGDVIIALDGQPVKTSNELTTRLAQSRPGDRVELRIIRKGKDMRIPVELGEFETQERTRVASDTRPDVERRLGFRVAPITPEVAARIGQREGVRITQVSPLSAAGRAGLFEGLVILRVNGETVSGPAELRRITDALEPGAVISLIVTDPRSPAETIINFRTER